MKNLGNWKYQNETTEFVKELTRELTDLQKFLTDPEFGGLSKEEKLDREYCRAIGSIQAFSYILKLIDNSDREIEDNKDEIA